MRHVMTATNRVHYTGLNILELGSSAELPDEQGFFFDLKYGKILNM